MRNLSDPAVEGQAAHLSDNSGEVHPSRKIGVEIVRSAELSSRFFRGWRAASYTLRNGDDLCARRASTGNAMTEKEFRGAATFGGMRMRPGAHPECVE